MPRKRKHVVDREETPEAIEKFEAKAALEWEMSPTVVDREETPEAIEKFEAKISLQEQVIIIFKRLVWLVIVTQSLLYATILANAFGYASMSEEVLVALVRIGGISFGMIASAALLARALTKLWRK